MIVLGWEEVIRLDEVLRVEPHNEICVLIKRDTRELVLCPHYVRTQKR